MPCSCGKNSGASAQKYRVRGTGVATVDKVYDNQTAAQLALATSGKTGVVEPV